MFCQFHIGIGLGYGTDNKAVAALNIGYEWTILVVDAQIRPTLSRDNLTTKNFNNYIGGSLGINLINPDDAGLSVIPSVGYYHNSQVNGLKGYNEDCFGYSLKSIIMFKEEVGLQFEGLYINKGVELLVGIAIKFY